MVEPDGEIKDTKLVQEKEENEDICEQSINLLDLPLELFLKICSYLEADFIPTLSLVCLRFEEILSDGTLWRCWVSRRLKHHYPAIKKLRVWQEGPGIDWQAACGDIDRETRRWTNVPETMVHKIVKEGHYATVDSVLLFNNAQLCVSGARDRNLALWNVSDIRSCQSFVETNGAKYLTATPVKLVSDAHRGWVWDLAVDGDSASTVYSGSWDNTVKAWDLESGLKEKQTFKCNMSVLSVLAEGDLIMAGIYSRQVIIFDARAGPEPILKYKLHKGPVLKLQKNRSLIASLSEDRTIAVWDEKAGKPLVSQIKCTGDNCFPVCFSWTDAAMYVGDSRGSLHLLDPEELTHVRSYELWEPVAGSPCDKIAGIYQGLGSMVVASDRGALKCLYPSDPVEEFAGFRSAAGLITNIQYEKGIFAVGTCDSSLEFWFPRETVSLDEPV